MEGKCTRFTAVFDENGSTIKPSSEQGTLIANEGMIQLLFSLGEFEKGDELISDYRLQNGTFKADGGLSLKKIVQDAPVKKS